MFAPATAGGPSTMDVLRERMLEKKQGSLKAAKLNTSLALKIKTKILNNSSIVHTSMKINNKALALALSAQKEKCKLLEQEMIKLQREAMMLYVQNASYSHRQNHLLSLLKELQQSTHERLDAAVQMCSVEDCPSPTGSKRSSKPPLSNNAGTSFQNVSNEATCAAQKSPVVSLEKPVLQPQPRRPVQEKCFLQSPLEENAVNRQPESGHFLENMQHIHQEDASGIFASPSPVVKEPSYPRVSPDRVIKKGRRSCLVTAGLFESYSKGSPGTDDSTVIKTGKKQSGVGSPGVSLAESNGSKESLELQVPKQETTVFDAEMELTVNEETEIVTVESNSRGKNIGENRTAKPRSKKGDPEALRNIKKKKRDPSKAIPLVNSTRPVSEKQRSIKPLDTDKAISDAVGSDLQTASSASAAEVSVAANKQLHQGEERCRITDASLNTECEDRRNTYKVSVFQNAEYTDCRKAGIVSSEALKYANKCGQSRAQLVQMEEPLDQPKDLLEENTLADFQTVETKLQDFLNVETKESRRTYLVSGPPSGTDWNTAGKDNRRTFVISDFQKAKPTASGLSHVEPGQEENLQNLALKDKPEENAHSSNLKLCDGAFVMSDRYVTKRENFIITPPLYKADGYSVVEACETEVCESNSTAKVSKHKDNSSRKRRNVVDEVCAEIGTHCNNTVTHSHPESCLNDPVVQRSAKRSRIPQKSCSNPTQGERNDNPDRKTYVVHPANKLKSSESSPENQTKKVKSKSRCAKVAFKEPGVPNPCFIFTHNESECVKGSKTASQENHLEVSGSPLKRESSSLATTNSDRAGGVILKLPCVQKASAGGGGGVGVCSVQDTCASEQTPMTVASPGAAAQRAEEHSAILESLQKLVQEDSSLGGFQRYGPETQECGLFQNLHSLVNTVKESEKIAHTVKRSRDKTPDGRILQTVTNTSLSTCEEAGIAKKRRRAAAVANYKEPRLNSKLRREDQEKLQPSVYKEYKKLNEIQIKLESDVPM